MCTININDVIGFEIESFSYNWDTFKKFVEKKLCSYFEKHRCSILIMDNYWFHHSFDVLWILWDRRISYKFISPYSRQLNPNEEFFGALKANYKAIRPRPSSTDAIKAEVRPLLESQSNPERVFSSCQTKGVIYLIIFCYTLEYLLT